MRKRLNVPNTYGPSLTEAKNYLRQDSSDDDTLISSLITASYDQIVAECNRDFLPVTYSMSVFSSSGDVFLTSQDTNYVSTGSLFLGADDSWYTNLGAEFSGDIVYHCNISGSLPVNVKIAQMMLINNWYENRLPQAIGVSTAPLSYAVDALLNPYKIIKPQ
jgi:hypothetical protein